MNKYSLKVLSVLVLTFCGKSFTLKLEKSSESEDFLIDLSQFDSRLFGNPVESDETKLNSNENAEEQGPYLEGDLLIPSDSKNGMKAESYRWKNGEIPFVINGGFTAHNMDMIERSLIEYHKNTCLKFIPRRSSDKDYISIESSSTGCWSSVGRIGGKQIVNLQTPSCLKKIGTVIHELKHAAGFMHEQNREDRDNFVKINSKNIKRGMEGNFNKAKSGETNSFGVKYDYGSVMHYSATSFSKDGKPTIEAKQKTSSVMGQRDGFSKSDIEKINKMYKCKGASSTGSTTKTPNQSPILSLIGAFG